MAGPGKTTGHDRIQAVQDKVSRMKDQYDAIVADLNALLKRNWIMPDL